MKKLTAFWERIPRPLRTILQIVAILLCVVICYGAIGAPPLTTEMQYRRVEQSHMIGPGRILGTETVSEGGQEKLLIAKSDSHLMLYSYSEGNKTKSFDLRYWETREDLSILIAGESLPFYHESQNFTLPIILFDKHPDAVRAEVSFRMFLGDYTDPQHKEPYEKHFHLESTRSHEGYFYFRIEHKAYTNHLYTKMLQALAEISVGYNNSEAIAATTPITVRLYNEAGEMIVNEIIYFRTPEDDLVRP
jgi:hypothetical protein